MFKFIIELVVGLIFAVAIVLAIWENLSFVVKTIIVIVFIAFFVKRLLFR